MPCYLYYVTNREEMEHYSVGFHPIISLKPTGHAEKSTGSIEDVNKGEEIRVFLPQIMTSFQWAIIGYRFCQTTVKWHLLILAHQRLCFLSQNVCSRWKKKQIFLQWRSISSHDIFFRDVVDFSKRFANYNGKRPNLA